MKNKKVFIGAVIVGLAGTAAYLVWKYIKGPTANDHTTADAGGAVVPPVKASSPSEFPLKNGSRNELVKQLQGLLGVTADGIFGLKTQAALLLASGKTSVASQTDYDALIKKISAKAVTNASVSRADKLVSDWKTGGALQLTAIDNVDAYGVVKDKYGALSTNNKSLKLIRAKKYNRADYVLQGSTQQGYVLFEVTKGDLKGLWKVDAVKITVS